LLIPGRLRDDEIFGNHNVPKEAEAATREGVAAWQELQSCLRELAEMNKERNLQQAREGDAS
jgi:hypothetical protein